VEALTEKLYYGGKSMKAKSTSSDQTLNEFSKSEEEEEDKQFIYYACRSCGGRHPQGVSCEEDGGEE